MTRIAPTDTDTDPRRRALSLAAIGLLLLTPLAATAKPKHQECDAEAAEERGCEYTPAHPDQGGKSHAAASRARARPADVAPAAGTRPAARAKAPAADTDAAATAARPAKARSGER